MPKAFLTGATGFIGGALLQELLRRGWEVRALVRPGADPRNLEGPGPRPERVSGDLLDRDAPRRGLEGCDALFHVAARYSLWNPHPAGIYRDNVEGTRCVLEAALQAGVGRVVHTSTVGTIRLPADGRPGDESRLSGPGEVSGHYKRSKILAEEVARGFAARGLPVVIVHPSAPVGPGDVKPTPTGQMLVDILRGKMILYPRTGLNIVGVEDVALGHILAWEKGRSGEGYILGGENLTLLEILRLLAGMADVQVPRWPIPRPAILAASLVSEALARLTGRPPGVPWEGVRMAGRYMFFSSSKAERELDYRPGPARGALERAVAWFVERGLAPGRRGARG